MKIQYFEDTDTLYIAFRPHSAIETRDLDENTLIDYDAQGEVCSITLEHAKHRLGDTDVQFERVSAEQGAAANP